MNAWAFTMAGILTWNSKLATFWCWNKTKFAIKDFFFILPWKKGETIEDFTPILKKSYGTLLEKSTINQKQRKF